jgi:hypothetical protein
VKNSCERELRKMGPSGYVAPKTPETTIGIWADEDGLQLHASRKPNGGLEVSIVDITSSGSETVKARVTLSPWRVKRLTEFLQ